MKYAFLLTLVTLFGCDNLTQKKTPAIASASTTAPVVEVKKPESKLPQTLTQKYQGRDAESWAADLYDLDSVRSSKGANGLYQIGDEGLRFFAKGMKSQTSHVRYNAVNQLPYKAVKEHKEIFLPLLTELLGDSSSGVRSVTAQAFLHCNFKEGLPDLRKAEEKETDFKVKADIGRYIKELENKKSD